MNFTLEQVMTEFPHTIQAHESAERAHALLIDYGVRHLPVEVDDKIIGVLSDRDVNLALSLHGGTAKVSVLSLCSKPAYMVTKDEPITLVLRTMAEQRYGCVLVADQGRLVGIATTSISCVGWQPGSKRPTRRLKAVPSSCAGVCATMGQTALT